MRVPGRRRCHTRESCGVNTRARARIENLDSGDSALLDGCRRRVVRLLDAYTDGWALHNCARLGKDVL